MIFKGPSVFKDLVALGPGTGILWWLHVFCLNMALDIEFLGSIPTLHTWPPATSKIIHQCLQAVCKENIWEEGIYYQFLWNFAKWCFRAILFLRTSLHCGQLYPEQIACLASTWHRTLNFLLDTYPQLRHCHWPPSSRAMKDSTVSGRKRKDLYLAQAHSCSCIYKAVLWNFARWFFNAILFPSVLGQCGQRYSEGVMCLASTWHLTLNFLLDK